MKFLLSLLLVGLVSADFSTSFKNFIISTYGQTRYNELARNDLGAAGSYGGGTHDGNSATSKRAIVIVHGITNSAGTFAPQRNYFLSNGWTDETVYATTYGTGNPNSPTAIQVKMECAFVKQVRNMIVAVANFTQQKVDVIGYSLGSPIARKAILGGNCVDTNENLGASLTSSVATYVSVAGANRGTSLCPLPILFVPACNSQTGLWCGSTFLTNINSAQHYEGDFVFSIYGPNDDKVGSSNLCGSQPNSQIAGSDGEISNAAGNHDAILIGTVADQKYALDNQSL